MPRDGVHFKHPLPRTPALSPSAPALAQTETAGPGGPPLSVSPRRAGYGFGAASALAIMSATDAVVIG
jgi:hypothetical protein